MADFKKSIVKTLIWEGGYVNDPVDPGGETVFGVSRRANPKWEGWKVADVIKSKSDQGNVKWNLEHSKELKELAHNLYHRKYWRNIYDKIESQDVANVLFDIGVNMGVKFAIRMLQTAYNLEKPLFKLDLETDGIIGPITLNAINEIGNPKSLNNCIVHMRMDRYWHICNTKPLMLKFIKGWMKRAISFVVIK